MASPASPDVSSRLPSTANDSAAVREKSAPRVVLLDDEPAILKTWSAILEVHGFEAVACEHAATALVEIASGCACVITDYHMPDMTGIEVIQQAKLCSAARFILMTANDSERLRKASLAAGADCVIAKPAPIATVIEIIEKLTRR